MTTATVRIPLTWPIGARSAQETTKDPYIQNGMLEKYGDKLTLVKRPGTFEFQTFGNTGSFQGGTYFNGTFYAVRNDTLYVTGGSSNTGADGGSWTQSSVPEWAATQGEGAVVFKGRMWMIGGVTASAGIWSSQDGKKWAVNAGGQPWGFRNNPGTVVFNGQIFVCGGFNITLGTCFNDVWSTSDGATWKNISLDRAGADIWGTRTNHMTMATNSGIYVMGGQDTTTSTYYADVWFSADGIAWSQLTAAAPWGARENASCFWFQNNLWVVGGFNSGGTALNDAWYSPDGITWTQASAAAFASGRAGCYSCVYRNFMWVIGGIDAGGSRVPDVYFSADGFTWLLATQTPGWGGRAYGRALVFQTPGDVSPYGYETMWLLGGESFSATLREVWRANLNTNTATSYPLTPDTTGAQFQFTTYNNGQQLLFKNSSNFYVLQAGTLIKIVDSNYPPLTVPGVVVLNAFAYVMTPGGEIHSCQLGDPTLWPALQFLTADYEDDPGIVLAKYLNYVVALGQYTTQFFFDNGANQPTGTVLAPYINANQRKGCVVAATVATVGNNLFWVGQDDRGTRSVMMLNGLVPANVSSAYVDRILMAAATNTLIAFSAASNGHQFYVLKYTAFNALVYDLTYQEWYEWNALSYVAYVTDFTTGGDYLFSDSADLVLFSPQSNTDALLGDFILRTQTDKVDHGNTALKFCGRVVLVGDVSDATPTVDISDDDYQTYDTLGTVDMTDVRPDLTRTGSFRRRAWRVSQEDDNPARWEALEVSYSQGES